MSKVLFRVTLAIWTISLAEGFYHTYGVLQEVCEPAVPVRHVGSMFRQGAQHVSQGRQALVDERRLS